MRNVHRVFLLLPAFGLLTASCGGFGPFGRCPEGSSISDRELVEAGVRKLVLQSQHRNPEWVRYRSVAEFFERNPDCCSITQPDNYAGEPINLPIGAWSDMPFGGTMEYSIRYRRLKSGGAPYAVRSIYVGPCPTHMEEYESPLTSAEYEARRTWRRNWRVR